jgi:cytochrome c-type biogenesis protein CcmH
MTAALVKRRIGSMLTTLGRRRGGIPAAGWLAVQLAFLASGGVLAAIGAPVATVSGAVPVSQALDTNGQLENPLLQSRFERIAKDLRCLVCQNESIADSNVELASDLRRQVREMLVAGKSDDAIFDFMTDRYGDFVRFSPPLKPKTLLIWGAPFIMLIIGAGIIYRVARQRSRMPLDDEPAPGSQ